MFLLCFSLGCFFYCWLYVYVFRSKILVTCSAKFYPTLLTVSSSSYCHILFHRYFILFHAVLLINFGLIYWSAKGLLTFSLLILISHILFKSFPLTVWKFLYNIKISNLLKILLHSRADKNSIHLHTNIQVPSVKHTCFPN